MIAIHNHYKRVVFRGIAVYKVYFYLRTARHRQGHFVLEEPCGFLGNSSHEHSRCGMISLLRFFRDTVSRRQCVRAILLVLLAIIGCNRLLTGGLYACLLPSFVTLQNQYSPCKTLLYLLSL